MSFPRGQFRRSERKLDPAWSRIGAPASKRTRPIRTTFILAACLVLAAFDGGAEHRTSEGTAIPTKGNSWFAETLPAEDEIITRDGIVEWTTLDRSLETTFAVTHPGSVELALDMRVPEGVSLIEASFAGTTRTFEAPASGWSRVPLGTFEVTTPGYQQLALRGLSTTASRIADIRAVIVTGDHLDDALQFVGDEFYWGRRGPSVHLRYDLPQNAGEFSAFTTEVTVPSGQDVEGSFFMATGFAHGYFGMQVNSATERRVLFSIWSPHPTDDPTEIPEAQRVVLLEKGDGVHTGEFGNEGSGGQSYATFMWKPDTPYRFLLRARPGEGHSDYSAYFFAPEVGEWQLVASFRRPDTTTQLTQLHSFLENFRPHTGNRIRSARYGRVWALDTAGLWHPLTQATFTADATARKRARLDYAGGTDEAVFTLKNCGFFTGDTPLDSTLRRSSESSDPGIDFADLP